MKNEGKMIAILLADDSRMIKRVVKFRLTKAAKDVILGVKK